MLRIIFSQEDIDTLFRERYTYPHPRVQKRLEAMYLKSQGVSHGDIVRLVKISYVSLAQWIQLYQEGGVAALKILRYKGRDASLAPYRGAIEEYLQKNPPTSVRDACAKIEQLTGIRRSVTPVRNFLKSIGMSFRKTGNVPKKADPVKQEEFKKKALSQFCKKPKRVSEKYSSSTPLISSGQGLWVFCGA
jgi:transposase